MALAVDIPGERLVKSDERVRDLGEVFTPSATVAAILDMLPGEMWAVHPAPTFLEPSCGDGNFLVAVLERKLTQVAHGHAAGSLPAGTSSESTQFHGLEALASIYGVDISSDNVIGGTPGHEIGARTRLLNQFVEWNRTVLSKRLSERSPVLRAAEWILNHNILVANMLPVDAEGRPTGRDLLPIVEYLFEPSSQTVTLQKTTLGDVIAEQESVTSRELLLFGPAAPVQFWAGKALNMSSADRLEAPRLSGPARNGREGA